MVHYLFEAPAAHERGGEYETGRKRPYNRPFLRSMARLIHSQRQHPLKFLINPRTGWWWSTSPWSAQARYHPAIQAGHGDSNWAVQKGVKGMRERLYIEDALKNQLSSQTIESKGGMIQQKGVLIAGVPVDLGTAQMWIRMGLLPAQALARAPRDSGWLPPSH